MPISKPNFTMLDNRIICDTRLSHLAVRLYAFILSVNEDYDLSVERLAKELDMHTQTISKALQNLTEFGYFERRFENLEEGRGKVAIYILFSFEEAKENVEYIKKAKLSLKENV